MPRSFASGLMKPLSKLRQKLGWYNNALEKAAEKRAYHGGILSLAPHGRESRG